MKKLQAVCSRHFSVSMRSLVSLLRLFLLVAVVSGEETNQVSANAIREPLDF